MAGIQAPVPFKDVQELGYRPRKDNIAQCIRSLHPPWSTGISEDKTIRRLAEMGPGAVQSHGSVCIQTDDTHWSAAVTPV
jgi:hypothetical protein